MRASSMFEPKLAPALVLTLTSRFDEISTAVDQVVTACGTPVTEPGIEAMDALRLALAEVLNNLVEHGYKDQGAQPVAIRLWRARGLATVCIADRGTPLPPGITELTAALADPDPMAALEALPEGGWGWMLIRESVDRIEYWHQDGENLLLLEKHLPGDPGPG